MADPLTKPVGSPLVEPVEVGVLPEWVGVGLEKETVGT